MIENPKVQLPEYISHKRVRAAEILAIGQLSQESAHVRVILNGFGEVMMPFVAFARYMPHPGDFLVEYDDGYRSFSPRKAFLEGYSPAPQGNVLMERLSDLANAWPPVSPRPEWLRNLDWASRVAPVAREAYVTINSLKHQLETIHREKANDLQAGRSGSDELVAGAAGVHPAAGAGLGDCKEG